MKIRQAVILAGGKGERLRPLTLDKPKPMVPVAGRPFLLHLTELLKKNGIEEIVMLLGYMPEKITEYFGDGSGFGIKINYSVGSPDDETGTRIKNARHLLDDHFLLMYGDNYWPLNLKEIADSYFQKGKMAIMTAYNNKDGKGEYGYNNNLKILENGIVSEYLKDGYSADKSYNAIDIGCFILSNKVCDLMDSGNFSFQREILPRLIKKGELAGYLVDHPYYPITDVGKLKTAEKFFTDKIKSHEEKDILLN
jgi:D-glycero-D-manno-heptose 1,7-bisphosphate phosphatase